MGDDSYLIVIFWKYIGDSFLWKYYVFLKVCYVYNWRVNDKFFCFVRKINKYRIKVMNNLLLGVCID